MDLHVKHGHTDRQAAEGFFIFGRFFVKAELKISPLHIYEYLITRENFINRTFAKQAEELGFSGCEVQFVSNR